MQGWAHGDNGRFASLCMAKPQKPLAQTRQGEPHLGRTDVSCPRCPERISNSRQIFPSLHEVGNECTHYITACHGTVSTVCWQCACSSRRADTTSLPKLVKALSNIKTSALAAGKARRSKCQAQSRNRSLVISMSGVLYSTPLFCEAKAMVITVLAGGEITIQTIGACLAPHSQGMLSDAVPVGKEYRLRSPNSWPRQGLFCNANLPLGLCRMPQLCCSIAKYRRNTAACWKLEVSAIHIWWLSPRNRTPAVSSEH